MRYLPDLRLVAFGLLIYVVVLIASYPAERGYAHLQARGLTPPGLQLGGLQGSIWSGSADVAVIQGQTLRSVTWQLQPWALFTGTASVAWSFQIPGEAAAAGHGTGVAQWRPGGSVVVPQFEGRLPARFVATLLNARAVRPEGLVSLNLNALRWEQQRLAAVTGKVVWSGAGINLFKPLPLGDLTLSLETVDGVIRGVIADAGGLLAIDGLLTLSADGRYQLTGEASARPGQDSGGGLGAALGALGRADADGKVHFSHTGALPGSGPRQPATRKSSQ